VASLAGRAVTVSRRWLPVCCRPLVKPGLPHVYSEATCAETGPKILRVRATRVLAAVSAATAHMNPSARNSGTPSAMSMRPRQQQRRLRSVAAGLGAEAGQRSLSTVPTSQPLAAATTATAAVATTAAAAVVPAAGLSARGEHVRTSKQQTQATALYYGGSALVGPRRAATNLPALIDLGVAESYPTVGPIIEAEGLTAAVAEAAASAVLGPDHAAMYPQPESGPLREAIAAVMAENVLRGAPCRAEEVVVAAGATAALEALVFAICNENDALIVPAPLYPAFYIDVGMRAGVTIIPTKAAAGAGPITYEALTDAAQRACDAGKTVRGVLFTSPCNPRGTLHTRAETAAVEAFAVERGVHLIHDAVYAGTAFDESEAVESLPQLPEAYRDGRLHTLWALSKDFGLPGWKVGVVHSRNPHVLQAIEPQLRFAGASRLAQFCSLALLRDPVRARRCLRRAASALQGRAKAGREALLDAGMPAAALAGGEPGAGPLDLIDFGAAAASLDEEALWEQMLECGVHVVRGEACGVGRPGAMRVCWGGASSDDEAREAARRMAKAFFQQLQLQQ
jgi:aspartate/methionine/tyrosine aminotransferase